jgi:hypothetical protein
LALSLPSCPFNLFPFGFRSWAKPALQKNREKGLTQAERTALCQIDRQKPPLCQKIENTMKPNTLKSTASPACAERIGRTLGRAWRSVLRLERNACAWLMAQGLPTGIARALPLILRLAVLGVVLYAAFWLAILVISMAVAVWNARNANCNWMREPEWREGFSGYGLYTYDDFRIDPYFYEDD